MPVPRRYSSTPITLNVLDPLYGLESTGSARPFHHAVNRVPSALDGYSSSLENFVRFWGAGVVVYRCGLISDPIAGHSTGHSA
jgi:hypothetical protein